MLLAGDEMGRTQGGNNMHEFKATMKPWRWERGLF
jgi:hypothetical protein